MTEAHTPGPWRSVIDDTGGQWSGWPLCIVPENDDDKSVVRTGGQWPYEWDAATNQREAVANARLIAAAPDLLEACRLAVGPLGSTGPTPAYEAVLAAILKATATEQGERG